MGTVAQFPAPVLDPALAVFAQLFLEPFFTETKAVGTDFLFGAGHALGFEFFDTFGQAFHRLGMDWSGENHALLIDWLEGELGYTGTTITDQFEAPQMDSVDGLLNGTHVWLGTTSDSDGRKVCHAVLLQDDYKNDPVIQDALFGAVHRALYNYAHSLAMNGLTHDYVFTGNQPLVTAIVSTAEEGTIGAPCAFYGDKTYVAEQSGFFGRGQRD